MIRILFFIFLTIGIYSCSSGTDNPGTIEAKDSVPAGEHFEEGKIIEKVINLNNASQSYAMYLPSSYTDEKSYPVIYIFDAHGNGKLPLSMYQALAEKYNYILIASNDSKNGIPWRETVLIANNLFSDSQQRISINSNRIYVMGFSGGARVANGLCITNGAISGVICCGAAAPAANSKDPRNNYTYLGICGNKDFNYIEMRKYDMVELAGRGVKHAFIEFDGKHEWPKEEIMKEAFLWTELGAMRKDPTLKNDALINEQFSFYAKKIKESQQNNKPFETYNLVRKTINFFDGLTDLGEYFSIYNPLKANAEVDTKLKQEETIWKKEEELKQYYQEAFNSKKIAWWKQDIASLKRKIANEKKDDETLMHHRVLDYLSLVAYMQTTNAMNQGNLPGAKNFSDIYLLVDPLNNEAHYLSATIYAMQGNDKEAIRELNIAVDNGFTDSARMLNEQAFSSLSASGEFKTIVKKINVANQSDSLSH